MEAVKTVKKKKKVGHGAKYPMTTGCGPYCGRTATPMIQSQDMKEDFTGLDDQINAMILSDILLISSHLHSGVGPRDWSQ